MTENELRDEMCRIGQSLFARGYVHATAGNISVRMTPEHGGGYLITPTDACLGFLDPTRLARLGSDGTQISGDRASKTIVLHRRIYEASANTGSPAACIIHTHSTHCVALTLRGPQAAKSLPAEHEAGPAMEPEQELLPALTPYFVMKVGHVPVIGYRRPGDPQAAEAVASAIARYQGLGMPIRAVMLERLGPNVWHDSPAQAMAVLEELEETAKLWHLTQGKPAPLGAEAMDELRTEFGASW